MVGRHFLKQWSRFWQTPNNQLEEKSIKPLGSGNFLRALVGLFLSLSLAVNFFWKFVY